MLKKINNIRKNISFWVIISCMVSSCLQQNTNNTFIVPPNTISVYETTNSKIPQLPPPNRAYYFPSNFIIDTAGQVFYYQEKGKWNNDTQIDCNTPPVFINLKPKDIVQIPINNIEEFIKLNILNIDSTKRYVAIASVADTINSLGLSKIITMCNEKTNHIKWKFRITTQEEAIVLDYKKRQKDYYSDDIKWDSTKIRMQLLEKQNN